MAWVEYNANPKGRKVGDCTVRAISKAVGETWEDSYSGIALQGFLMCDMPSANSVTTAYLKRKGYRRRTIPDTCPECYTVEDFCQDHPHGTYILGIGNHLVAVIDGDWYDAWDSGNEIPIYYFTKEE
jgi:hypothetical protein